MGTQVELRQSDQSITPLGGIRGAAKTADGAGDAGAERHLEIVNTTNVFAAATSTFLLGDAASRVRIQYIQTNSTVTGRMLYVVLNAYNDADAAAKLALASTRDDVIPLNGENTYLFPVGQECTRVDVVTDQALGGATNLVRVDYTV